MRPSLLFGGTRSNVKWGVWLRHDDGVLAPLESCASIGFLFPLTGETVRGDGIITLNNADGWLAHRRNGFLALRRMRFDETLLDRLVTALLKEGFVVPVMDALQAILTQGDKAVVI